MLILFFRVTYTEALFGPVGKFVYSCLCELRLVTFCTENSDVCRAWFKSYVKLKWIDFVAMMHVWHTTV
jgi:hypothetical protein